MLCTHADMTRPNRHHEALHRLTAFERGNLNHPYNNAIATDGARVRGQAWGGASPRPATY